MADAGAKTCRYAIATGRKSSGGCSAVALVTGGSRNEEGTPLFGSDLPEEKVRAILEHIAEGCGVPETARLVGVRQTREREGLTLTVLFGQRPHGQAQKQEIDTQPLVAKARFYVDPYKCRVVGVRKRAGVAQGARRAIKESADLADVADVSVNAFVREVLRFLEWASVGEGKGSRALRFRQS
jgi:hypothetical protein